MSEEEMIDGPAIVVLEDEEGNEVQLALLAMLEVEDQEYALMAPVADLEAEDGETTLYLFRHDEEEGVGSTFSTIDDDATYAQVQAFCETIDIDALVQVWMDGEGAVSES